MKPKHTPGPWMASTHMSLSKSLSVAFIKYTQAFGQQPHGTQIQMAAMIELMPDKRYIAAPELLEAAKEILNDSDSGEEHYRTHAIETLREAIAKAEGK